MSRVLVCSGIRGLTDALKKVLRPEISCQEVILEETLKIIFNLKIQLTSEKVKSETHQLIFD